jgi:FdhD protein
MTKNIEPDPSLVQEFPILRFKDGVLEKTTLFTAKEVPYTLFVNDYEILSIATLPTHLEELFVGFLVSEGVLTSPRQIKVLHVDHPGKIVRMEIDVPPVQLDKIRKKGMLTSGCAGGLTFAVQSDPVEQRSQMSVVISVLDILNRMRDLDTFKGIYVITRGVHAASLASKDETLLILEDLGRHNAVDKIAGYCFMNEIETRNKMLLTTGRITSEVLVKTARSGFPVVISRSSASALAINSAKRSSIDVITYVKGRKFNYFNHGGIDLVEV